MISKIKTAIWFLQQPKLYLQFFQLVKSRIFPVNEKRAEATRWCKELALSPELGFRQITNHTLPFDLSIHFQNEISMARDRITNFPNDRGGPGDINLIYHLCEHTKAINVLETGVAYGWSSLAILLSLNKRDGSLLVSTDMPYAKMDGKDYVGSVVPDHLKLKWELIRLPDRQGLPIAIDKLKKIDICHYDSDKSYRGRMWAYPKLWQSLKPGGIFISDDIGDNFAFRDFALKIKKKPIVIASEADKNVSKFVGILIKTDE